LTSEDWRPITEVMAEIDKKREANLRAPLSKWSKDPRYRADTRPLGYKRAAVG
jgi:hypothetical protein